MTVMFYIIQLKKQSNSRNNHAYFFVYKGEFRQTDKGKKGNA